MAFFTQKEIKMGIKKPGDNHLMLVHPATRGKVN